MELAFVTTNEFKLEKKKKFSYVFLITDLLHCLQEEIKMSYLRATCYFLVYENIYGLRCLFCSSLEIKQNSP